MIIAPSAEPVTDIVRIDVAERNVDGTIKTANMVEINEVLLIRKTDSGGVVTESLWKREVYGE